MSDHAMENVEATLAHTLHNQVNTAYARSDLFERRHRLVEDWASYLARKTALDAQR